MRNSGEKVTKDGLNTAGIHETRLRCPPCCRMLANVPHFASSECLERCGFRACGDVFMTCSPLPVGRKGKKRSIQLARPHRGKQLQTHVFAKFSDSAIPRHRSRDQHLSKQSLTGVLFIYVANTCESVHGCKACQRPFPQHCHVFIVVHEKLSTVLINSPLSVSLLLTACEKRYQHLHCFCAPSINIQLRPSCYHF